MIALGCVAIARASGLRKQYVSWPFGRPFSIKWKVSTERGQLQTALVPDPGLRFRRIMTWLCKTSGSSNESLSLASTASIPSDDILVFVDAADHGQAIGRILVDRSLKGSVRAGG
jgi:hypothetical protein